MALTRAARRPLCGEVGVLIAGSPRPMGCARGALRPPNPAVEETLRERAFARSLRAPHPLNCYSDRF